MYNGIGLDTARGSGTNGYVQRNLGALRHHRDKVWSYCIFFRLLVLIESCCTASVTKDKKCSSMLVTTRRVWYNGQGWPSRVVSL